mgnify:CR=1 FL=1
MNVLRTLDSIINNVWGDELGGKYELNTGSPIASYEEWDYTKSVDISKVKIWEQLYHEPGNIGLFASWNPYIECYIIVYYPFIKSNNGIIVYYGKDSCYDVSAVMKELSLNFDIFKINQPIVAI